MKYALLQNTLINLDRIVAITRIDAGSMNPDCPTTVLPNDLICLEPGCTISYKSRAARDQDWQRLLDLTEPDR